VERHKKVHKQQLFSHPQQFICTNSTTWLKDVPVFIEGDISLGKEVARVSLMCLVLVNNFH
jgi:hypothetical protein